MLSLPIHPFCRVFVNFLATLLLAAAPVVAQEQPPGTALGTGEATVELRPTILRMVVQLSEQGKTVDEALAKLKDRRQAAVLQLETLGAEKDSIVVAAPVLSSGTTDQQRQMEMMLRRQLQSFGRQVPEGLRAPSSVTVAATLTAEWSLPESDDQWLLAVHGTQEKVSAADLAGLNEPKQQTPEEEEFAEELAQLQEQTYGQPESAPGEPRFVYVARISDEERRQALAEAFAQAQEEAAQLAAAAKTQLGQLVTLSGEDASQTDPYDPYGYGVNVAMRTLPAKARSNEAVAAQPGPVTFAVTVRAAFRLENTQNP